MKVIFLACMQLTLNQLPEKNEAAILYFLYGSAAPGRDLWVKNAQKVQMDRANGIFFVS